MSSKHDGAPLKNEDDATKDDVGGTFIDLENDPNAEIIEIDKSKPIDFEEDDEADDAATAEEQYRDSDCDEEDGNGDGAEEDNENIPEDDTPVEDKSISAYKAHTDQIYAVAANPTNPQMIATGSADDSFHIVDFSDLKSPKCVFSHNGSDSVSRLAFSPDGTRLAAGFLDGVIIIVDVLALTILHELNVDGDFECFSWQPASSVDPGSFPLLVSGNSEGVLHVWDTTEGYPVHVLPTSQNDCISAVVFTRAASDGPTLVVSGHESGQMILWDITKGRAVTHVKPNAGGGGGGGGSVLSVGAHPSHPLVAAGTSDGGIRVISVSNASATVVFDVARVHKDSVETVIFGGPQSMLLATISTDCCVKVWDAARNWSPRQTLEHPRSVVDAVWIPGLPFLITGAADGAMRAWDARDGRPLGEWFGSSRAPLYCMALALGKGGVVRAVTGGENNVVTVFDVADVVRGQLQKTATVSQTIRK